MNLDLIYLPMELKEPSSNRISIALSSLAKGRVGVSPAYGASLVEAASVCISGAGHPRPAAMPIKGKFNICADISWDDPDRSAIATWNDEEFTTEQGAYCIAILLVEEFGLEVKQRSRKGTGFDYWLGDPEDKNVLFQGLSRLEVSGIRSGGTTEIDKRIRIKEKQTEKSDSTRLPAVIAVIEFGTPTAKITERCPT